MFNMKHIIEKNKFGTREEWLEAAIELMRPLFKSQTYEIPKLHVACGWPHRGGTSKKKRVFGQCWSEAASADGLHQIFVSPFCENKDEYGVLPVLVHEVVHAVVGIEAKHGKVFRKCAEAVGLTGKMTSTVAGDVLTVKLAEWQKTLGEYPHARLDLDMAPVKKQTTRMIKMTCGECGYVARTARKWIDEVGPAHCPRHGEMATDLPADKEEGDE